jgi:fluoride exporter
MKTSWQQIALVFLGGALGTAARYAVSLTLPQIAMLFVVNLLGAAFLGLVNSAPLFESGNSKTFWGVGFAGGFTTMSGVALWMVATQDRAALAPVTVLAMFAVGVLAYFGGLRIGRAIAKTGAKPENAANGSANSEAADE